MKLPKVPHDTQKQKVTEWLTSCWVRKVCLLCAYFNIKCKCSCFLRRVLPLWLGKLQPASLVQRGYPGPRGEGLPHRAAATAASPHSWPRALTKQTWRPLFLELLADNPGWRMSRLFGGHMFTETKAWNWVTVWMNWGPSEQRSRPGQSQKGQHNCPDKRKLHLYPAVHKYHSDTEL